MNCHGDASCLHSPESQIYQCQCNEGYEGNGYMCTIKTGNELNSYWYQSYECISYERVILFQNLV